MDENITCVICGGTNFYKESGYYFCNECQTQTQEIKEQVFDEFDVKQEIKPSRKISLQPTTQLNQVKLTTWECYNYVLKGLTDELINLGANRLLKTVVKKLWLKYLLKIEVVNMEKPKLQAVNSKIDAEIIYGKRKKRKRKPRSRSSQISDADLSSLDSASLKRERTKRRRALIKAQYNHSLSKSMDSSLLNETLTSLKSTSEGSSRSSIPLRYNKYAKKELRKKQTEKHLHLHLEDFENTMTCHQNSYNEASKFYQNSPHLLSINKIYSILYLGLLLSKSEIQLSDMLRFIREGHLSFNNFKHFFPDEMNDNFLTQGFPRKFSLFSASLRRSAYRVAKFLDVLKFLEIQNLASLIDKFCRELNLPCIIKERAISTLLISSPKMRIVGKVRTRTIPNYEGRALSIILFQLKLFFGIDGKSEKYLSHFVESLKKKDCVSSEMFDFMKWMQYLDYRRYILRKLHFPSQFFSDKQLKNSHQFVKFVLFKNPDYDRIDPCRKYNKSADDCRQLLNRLKERQENIEQPTIFEHSLTPSIDYVIKILRDQHVTTIEEEILRQNFTNCSIDYITNPSKFYCELNAGEKVKVKLRGANTNIKLFKLTNSQISSSNKLKEGRRVNLVRVRTMKDNSSDVNVSVTSLNSSIKVEEVEEYLKEFEDNHHSDKNRYSSILNLSSNDSRVNDCLYPVHFKPHKCYWINTDCNLGRLSKWNFEEHLSSYPSNFKFLLAEMARIGEQNIQDLLFEFSFTEIYLLYVETFDDIANVNFDGIYCDRLMRSLVTRSRKHW